METPYVKVFKAPKVILIVSDLSEAKVRQLVEGQIFFREFKSQLHRYLNIHRQVWEEIAAIKERGKIAGSEVKVLRGKISSVEEVDKYLDKVFQYKYEILTDTLSYIKELWKMTANYLSGALEMFKEIQN